MFLTRIFNSLSLAEKVIFAFGIAIILIAAIVVPTILLTRKDKTISLVASTTIQMTTTASTTTTATLEPTTTVYAPADLISNRCTASIPNPNTLLYYADQPAAFEYQEYTYRYRTRIDSTRTTLAFGYQHSSFSIYLDNITVIDTVTGFTVNLDGSFESNNLTGYYTQCAKEYDYFMNNGEISTVQPKVGYYGFKTNAVPDTCYLLQSFPTMGGRWLIVKFWMLYLISTPNLFIMIMGS